MIENTVKKNKKSLVGVIVSDKMDKTCVVKVTRYVKHPKYGKFFKLSKNYHAHDEANQYQAGQRVTIEETRPISKRKSFVIVGETSVANT